MTEPPRNAAAAIDAALRDDGPDAAAALAVTSRADWAADSRLAYAAGKTLLGGGNPALAAEAFGLAAQAEPERASWWSWLASAILAAGPPHAESDRLLAAAARYPDVGEVQLAAARVAHAAAHPDARRLAQRAATLLPGDAATQRHLGRVALAAGDLAAAAEALTIACAERPDATSLAQLGDALLRLNRIEEAADAYARLADLLPDDRHRQLAAANVAERAGRPADALYARALSLYRAAAPPTLAEGLAALHADDDARAVPQARLDAAWSLRSPDHTDRATWDRAARWGARAESLIVDWMIGAPDRWQDLRDITHIANPEMLAKARAGGRGVLLAGAHLGSLLAVPAALVDDAIRFDWIATSGGWDDSPISRALISSLRLSPRDVAWRLFAGLRAGHAILYAPDGDDAPTTPTRVVAGLRVPEVSFAPDMIGSARATSLFVAARWEAGRIVIAFSPMPAPEDSATAADFARVWGDAYYDYVRDALTASAPENLRLRGGIWSRVR